MILKLQYVFLLGALLLNSMSSFCSAQTSVETNRQNYTDDNGHRQGYWKIYGAMSVEEGYKKDAIVEEGAYVDNKRQGLWKKYYPNGEVRSEINYESNRPFGDYKVFHANGKLEEKGYWKGNKNTGAFKRYHENGRIAQDFTFNSKGKRNGIQKYYYENGKPQMQVGIENGVAHGMMKTFYPDGSKKLEQRITNGEVEEESVKTYEPRNKAFTDVDIPTIPQQETIPVKDEPNYDVFKESGYNTLYNKNKQLSQVGDFREGRLWDGKWYRYDQDGLLRKVEVYKEGRFIGYGIIEDPNN